MYSPPLYSSEAHDADHLKNGLVNVRYSGLDVTVSPFKIGSYEFTGGTIRVIPGGRWYIGVDLFTGRLVSLPRLGHRGWIPVAETQTDAWSITRIDAITPSMPSTRIPRTLRKLFSGGQINVLVMGSSLAEGTSSTTWSGMLFNSGGQSIYKVPNVGAFKNLALGGAPNQYQLAQAGFATGGYSAGFSDAGFPYQITSKSPPNGRSTIFSGVDLVVMTVLANGGDYRLETIEPLVRKIRKAGCEVILTTDNAQGAPFNSIGSMLSAPLWVDAPEVFRVAERYGVEVADTAAYVFDAYWRYPSIYGDQIHMSGGTPSSITGIPTGGGHEMYARAIRSLLTVSAPTAAVPVTQAYPFTGQSGLGGFEGFSSATLSVDSVNQRMVVTKNQNQTNQWGAWSPVLPPINQGDTVIVSGKTQGTGPTVSVGLQGPPGGWASNVTEPTTGSQFTVTLTASRPNTSPRVLFFANNDSAPINTEFYVYGVTITVNSSVSGLVNLTPGRSEDASPLPPIRIVTDLKTPADAVVILPGDEPIRALGSAESGALGAHPNGASSFARRFSSTVSASADLLTLTSGKRAILSSYAMVGASLIYYGPSTDAACTFDVYRNGSLQKTITIPTNSGYNRETYLPIYTPTQYNQTNPCSGYDAIEIRVTSGTLRVCALVALTADVDWVPAASLSYSGQFSTAVGTNPAMAGYATDRQGDYAYVKCPDTGNRVGFLVMGKSVSSPVNIWTGKEISVNVPTAGVNHVFLVGGKSGPGEFHYIQCSTTNASGNSVGYGMLVGGAMIVNDR